MTRKTFLQCAAGALAATAHAEAPGMLDAEKFRHHVDRFNGMLRKEEVVNPDSRDARAWDWMKARSCPALYSCPDAAA